MQKKNLLRATMVVLFSFAQLFFPYLSYADPVPGGEINVEQSISSPSTVSTDSHGTTTALPTMGAVPQSIISDLMGGTVLSGTNIIDVGGLVNGTVNYAGNFANQGTLYLVSTNPQVSSAIINAPNIFNSGLISTMLPTTGLAGFSGAISGLSLVLNAHDLLVNTGSITAAGSLTATAGTAIYNALPTGVPGPSPVMQAMQNLNLLSPNIVNAGLMSSLASNINVSSQLAQNILVNGVGGRFEALSGTINIRDQLFTPKFNTDILGGDLLSNELNIYSGDGIVNMNVGDITGLVNVSAGELYLNCVAPQLKIGNVNLTGDPIVSNGLGDMLIQPSSGTVFLVSGPITINAARDIIAQVDTIGSNGFNISMNAGRNIDLSPVTLLSSVGPSGSGGNITLTAGTSVSGGSIVLHPSGTTASGFGTIQMTANTGSISTGNLSSNGGHILLSAGTDVTTGSINAARSSGDIGGGVGVKSNLLNTSHNPFQIGSNNLLVRVNNAINGTLSTFGSTRRGTVSIMDFGGGGIVVDNQTALNLRPTAGQSSTLTLNAGSGQISLPTGAIATDGPIAGAMFLIGSSLKADNTVLSASSTGGSFANSLVVSASSIDVGQGLTINSKGNSGFVQLMSGGLASNHFLDATNAFRLQVSGAPNGQALAIAGPGNLTVDASGSNGTVQVFAGNTTVTANAVTLKTDGTNGAGGGYALFDVNNLTMANQGLAMSVNGHNFGRGGTIQVFGRGAASDLTLSSLSANAGANGGAGGFIEVETGRHLSLTGNATANGSGTGNGGFVQLYAANVSPTEGNLTITGSVRADGIGSATSSGGTVDIEAFGTQSDVSLSNGTFSASGGNNGFAGRVTVYAGDALSISNSTIESTGRSGSTVSLAADSTSGGALSIQSSTISADAKGADGNGGVVSISSGGDLAIADSTVSANGARTGGGVHINATDFTKSLALTGATRIEAMAGSFPSSLPVNGGSISLSSAGALSIGSDVQIDVGTQSLSGNAGSCTVSSGNSELTLAGTISSESAGNGGVVTVNYIGSNLLETPILVPGRITVDGNNQGGSITFANLNPGTPLLIKLDGELSATGPTASTQGQVRLIQDGQRVNLSSSPGKGAINAPIIASGSDVVLTTSKDGNVLSVKSIVATNGDVLLSAIGSQSKIEVGSLSGTAGTNIISVVGGVGLQTPGLGGSIIIYPSASQSPSIFAHASLVIQATGQNGTITVMPSTQASDQIVSAGQVFLTGATVNLGFDQQSQQTSGSNGAISGSSISVQGLEHAGDGGDVRLGTVLRAANQIRIETQGVGDIGYYGGLLQTTQPDGSVELIAHGGDIGTPITPIQLSTPAVRLTAFETVLPDGQIVGGFAVVAQEDGDLSLAESSVSNRLTATVVNGNLTVDAPLTAEFVTLSAVFGDLTISNPILALRDIDLSAGTNTGTSTYRIVVGSSGALLSGRSINLVADGGIGSASSPVRINQSSFENSKLTMRAFNQADAYIRATGQVTLGGFDVRGRLNLLTTGNITIEPLAPNQTISANTMVLESTGGNIGIFGAPLVFGATQISAKTSGTGTVFITESGEGPVKIFDSVSGGTFDFKTFDGVEIGNLTVTDGDIRVISETGSLLVSPGAQILASRSFGAAQIYFQVANPDENSRIILGNSSHVLLTSPVFPVIHMALGPIESAISPIITGSTNISVSTAGGGVVFYGPTGIAANPPENSIIATGGEIKLTAGPYLADHFILDGGTTIEVRGAVGVIPKPPGLGGKPPGKDFTPPGSNPTTNPGNGTAPPPGISKGDGLNAPGLSKPPAALSPSNPSQGIEIPPGQTIRIEKVVPKVKAMRKSGDFDLAIADAVFKPVAFVSTVSGIDLSSNIFAHADDNVSILASDSPEIGIDAFSQYAFEAGEALIVAKGDTKFTFGQATLYLKKGSIVRASRSNESVTLACLHNSGCSGTTLLLDERKVFLAPGEVFWHGDFDRSMKIRSERTLSAVENQSIAEFSISSLLATDTVLGHMRSSPLSADLKVMQKILKTAACVNLVTAHHGGFGAK